MSGPEPRLAGVELYFDDLARATRFYREALGLRLRDSDPQRYATFGLAPGFLCLERKGHEDYPSADKAVVFIEVADLRAALAAVPRRQLVRAACRAARPWAAVRDPEGHTVLLLQTTRRVRAARRGRAPRARRRRLAGD